MPFTDDEKQEIRDHLSDKLKFVQFPLTRWGDVLVALPGGADEPFRIQGWDLSALQVGQRFAPYADFPYESLDALIDDFVFALEESQ